MARVQAFSRCVVGGNSQPDLRVALLARPAQHRLHQEVADTPAPPGRMDPHGHQLGALLHHPTSGAHDPLLGANHELRPAGESGAPVGCPKLALLRQS